MTFWRWQCNMLVEQALALVHQTKGQKWKKILTLTNRSIKPTNETWHFHRSSHHETLLSKLLGMIHVQNEFEPKLCRTNLDSSTFNFKKFQKTWSLDRVRGWGSYKIMRIWVTITQSPQPLTWKINVGAISSSNDIKKQKWLQSNNKIYSNIFYFLEETKSINNVTWIKKRTCGNGQNEIIHF